MGKTKEGETKASKEKDLGNNDKGDEDGVAKAGEGLGKESLVEADKDDTQKSRGEEGGTAASANDNMTKENAALKTGEKFGKDGTTKAAEKNGAEKGKVHEYGSGERKVSNHDLEVDCAKGVCAAISELKVDEANTIGNAEKAQA